jgi:uncharacterized protein (DUF1800 family)
MRSDEYAATAAVAPKRAQLASALFVVALSACSGGGSSGGMSSPPPPPPPSPPPVSTNDAARFLTQATFGPTDTSIGAVVASGYDGWITTQQNTQAAGNHHAYIDLRTQQILAANPKAQVQQAQLFETWWREAVTGPDELRERVAFALSQIFVISMQDATVGKDIRGVADYYDMLTANAFGNYRALLENVTLHPQMGIYLTSLANQKENAATGLLPDENYAREVMQLFSIGLYQLNADGTVIKDSSGNPVPTYSHDDIAGLAKVFTGMSWYSPSPSTTTFFGGAADPNRDWKPMSFYPTFHSISSKSFLGTTIPAAGVPDIAGDLKIALDAIFNHPNVGPFIATRLIQQLVTSNPSTAYVGRVAAVFNNNGSGTRGDLGATVRAVLLDSEARDSAALTSATFGKLREPVVRLANWMRAFGAASQSQADPTQGGAGWLMTTTDDPGTRLGQSPMRAPTVFNFWQPSYVPPGTQIAAHGLVAPEFQIVDEVQVAGYLNFMQGVVARGVGSTPPNGTTPDIQPAYTQEKTLAPIADKLVARMNALLMYGQMSTSLQQTLTSVVSSVAIPGGTATQAQIDAAIANRVHLAVLLTMASPEYLLQR